VLDLDLMAKDGCRRRGGEARRLTVAAGGERRRRDPTKVFGLGSTRGKHLRDAREPAKLQEATAAAERRRGGRSTRRRGLRSPARSGEKLQAAQDSGSTTNDANILLTSKCVSGATP
jgi:hypothetical protein